MNVPVTLTYGPLFSAAHFLLQYIWSSLLHRDLSVAPHYFVIEFKKKEESEIWPLTSLSLCLDIPDHLILFYLWPFARSVPLLLLFSIYELVTSKPKMLKIICCIRVVDFLPFISEWEPGWKAMVLFRLVSLVSFIAVSDHEAARMWI